jgi:D-alanyl-D-alanine carboxypeptidase
MKTGFTCAAGYNIVASATRSDHHIVAVVLGEPSRDARSARATSLLEYGFKLISASVMANGMELDSMARSPTEPQPAVDLTETVHSKSCGTEVTKPARPRPGGTQVQLSLPYRALVKKNASCTQRWSARKTWDPNQPSKSRDIDGRVSCGGNVRLPANWLASYSPKPRLDLNFSR